MDSSHLIIIGFSSISGATRNSTLTSLYPMRLPVAIYNPGFKFIMWFEKFPNLPTLFIETSVKLSDINFTFKGVAALFNNRDNSNFWLVNFGPDSMTETSSNKFVACMMTTDSLNESGSSIKSCNWRCNVALFEDLDKPSLVKILKEPKNSLLKQYKRLFEFENVQLIFKEDAIVEIAKKAINKKTGARGLRSIIEALLLKTMFKLPTLEGVVEVIVDQSAVKNNSEPLLIYNKSKKTSAA